MKKYFVFWLAVLALSLVGCRTSSSEVTSPESSSLKGVYDGSHLLKLTKVAGSQGLYRFEVCRTSQGSSRAVSGTCVGALKNTIGEDLLFSMQAVDKMKLTEAEKEKLNQTHYSWQEYQRALDSKKGGQYASAGVLLGGGGGVLAGVFSSGVSVSATLQEQRALLDQARIPRDDLKGKYEAAEKVWFERFGDTSLADTQKSLLKVQDELIEQGISTTELPKATISAADFPGRKTILSDDFIDFFEARAKQWLDIKGVPAEAALKTPYPYKDLIRYESIIKRYFAEGHTIKDVFRGTNAEKFFAYAKTERSLQAIGGHTHFPVDFDEAADLLKKDHVAFFNAVDDFYSNRGISGTLQRNVNKIKLFAETLKLGTPSAPQKQALEAAEGAVRSADDALLKTLKRQKFLKTGLTVVLVGAGIISVVTLTSSGKGLGDAEKKVKEIDKRHSDLQVMLDPSSALWRADSSVHTAVPSVKKILESFALWQKLQWVDVEGTDSLIHHYCLPTTFKDGSSGQQCHWAPNGLEGYE